jgi:hypothetical protein
MGGILQIRNLKKKKKVPRAEETDFSLPEKFRLKEK